MLDVPAALHLMAWLQVPWHFLAVYAAMLAEFALAVVGAAGLLRRAGRRYRQALACLALSARLAAAAAAVERAAARRPAFTAQRIVHLVHPPHQSLPPRPAPVPPQAPAPRPATAAAPAADGEAKPGESCASAAAPRPARQLRRAAAPAALGEADLVALANNTVIGPLIELCRQHAGERP